MSNRVSRNDVRDVVKEWKGGAFYPEQSVSGSKLYHVLCQNVGNQPMNVGDAVQLDGTGTSWASLSPEQARNHYLTNGAVIGAIVAESDTKATQIGTAVEYIRQGTLGGVVTAFEIVPAMINASGNDFTTVGPGQGGLVSGGAGFRVLAKSQVSGGKCFVLCVAESDTWRLWIVNDGARTIHSGDLVGIHAMEDHDLDPEEAISNWVNEGVRASAKIIGDIDDQSAGQLARATSLDDIAPGDTGRAECPGLFMARIWRDPNEFKATERVMSRAEWMTVEIDGSENRRLAYVRYPGEYLVIDATRAGDDNFAFGLLTPSLTGHLISGIVAVDVESKRVTLSNGLTASYPVGTVTQDLVGKKAAVSRGMVNRQWEVLITADDD